jgi:uncharacterized cupin superfamily protein
MNENFAELLKLAGSFEGYGVNHEGQKFKGLLTITPQTKGKGFSLDFCAKGEDGTVFHKEHSLLGLNAKNTLSLWVLSDNHPAILEHTLDDENMLPNNTQIYSFRLGDLKSSESFREVITLQIFPNGDLNYAYAWGLPHSEFKERSSVQLVAGKNRPLIPEAKMKKTDFGLVPESDGWFVINAQDAEWYSHPVFGDACSFEGSARFEQYGLNVSILHPGKSSCHYHGEDDQENLLVLKGQCRLIIEGQERILKAWDFVHFPKWSRHVCVGMGDEPCITVMAGGRTGHGVFYPVIDLAKKHDASSPVPTDSPQVSYSERAKGVTAKTPPSFLKLKNL